ncbi:uncharacterized protein LOC130990761 [Salvia miltiorrhiza]|uniref:uncharacterized protein LOC130990761 n=1 Tax=Salvia miltiorrhiza TaxID=226208 RepID=UPI0025AD44A4|nr:uncharacterized protein LOC130990761 [Salvia miltiorrhiza]
MAGFYSRKDRRLGSLPTSTRSSLIFEPWRLRSGILFLQAWTPNFNPHKLDSSLAQVWVRIFNLPHELWHPEVITGIARQVGTPLLIDGLSARASVGNFARILVEINVALEHPSFLDVQCDENTYEIEFRYEDMPTFCCVFSSFGHSTDNCRKMNPEANSDGTELPRPNRDSGQVTGRQGGRGRRRRGQSRRKRARNRTTTPSLAPPEGRNKDEQGADLSDSPVMDPQLKLVVEALRSEFGKMLHSEIEGVYDRIELMEQSHSRETTFT